MNSELILKTSETMKIGKKISVSELVVMIREIEAETKWQILKMISDVQSNVAKSYSISKDKPRSSLFIYGRESHISITFETKEKEAKILMPRDANISPKY